MPRGSKFAPQPRRHGVKKHYLRGNNKVRPHNHLRPRHIAASAVLRCKTALAVPPNGPSGIPTKAVSWPKTGTATGRDELCKRKIPPTAPRTPPRAVRPSCFPAGPSVPFQPRIHGLHYHNPSELNARAAILPFYFFTFLPLKVSASRRETTPSASARGWRRPSSVCCNRGR